MPKINRITTYCVYVLRGPSREFICAFNNEKDTWTYGLKKIEKDSGSIDFKTDIEKFFSAQEDGFTVTKVELGIVDEFNE